MDNLDKNEAKENLIRIIKGSGIALGITLAFLFIYAILLTYTNIQENTMIPVVIIITAISILIGSSLSTLKIKKNGLINGTLVGIIYIFLLYIISSVTGSGFSLNLMSIIMVTASIIAGMIGGIIGVNLN